MPAYDYKCVVCGDKTEVKCPMTDAKEIQHIPCFSCGTFTPHRRVWKAPAAQFKGAGFYTTDSRDDVDKWTFNNLDKD